PPEISGDIARDGIYLLGGLSRLGGLSEYISSQLNIPVIKVEHPQNITGIGTGKACKHFKKIKNSKRF
ncbi:MAG: rod shape-determining protein, partial [Tissierellia bacterium]|nr:rod shape-determining protein [Tissierellia bacterium]